MRRLVGSLFLATLAGAGVLRASDTDEERSAWRWRRPVSLAVREAGSGPLYAALPVPPEVGTRCQADLRDLRLVGPDGREVQYVVDRVVERSSSAQWTGRLVDTRPEKKVRTAWVVDFGATRVFDTVTLEVPGQDFAKRFQVEASDDARGWRGLAQDVGVFDRAWGGRIRHTAIALPERTAARYLRLTADDHRSKPIEVTGVTVSASRRVTGEAVRRPVPIEALGSSGGRSRYRLRLPPGFPLETLEVDGDDPAFSREVAVFEMRPVGAQRVEVPLGVARVYRLRIEDEALSGESITVPVQQGQGGDRILEVRDGDSPPLHRIRVSAVAPATRLVFPASEGPLVLYYGNELTRSPLYDLQALKGRLGLAPAFVIGSLGEEVENPRYRKPTPIPFAASRGAELAAPRWKATRPLAITGGEDVYTFTLAGQDLGLLREDLGDLRIADAAGLQVPYILEPGAAEARLSLTLQPEPARTTTEGRVSRYRIRSSAPSGEPLPLPLVAVEVAFGETFFSRPGKLLAPAGLGDRGGARVLFSGMLSSTAGSGSGLAVAVPEPASLRIGLDGGRRAEMVLEVQEGDNQALTLRSVSGVLRVPRVAFKAAPGAYQVLLGNPRAAAPRYDIAALRQEILAYSALPVEAGATGPNPSFRRSASDYFKDAPPTLLLWGTLLVAVVVLLLLTARILRQPQP